MSETREPRELDIQVAVDTSEPEIGIGMGVDDTDVSIAIEDAGGFTKNYELLKNKPRVNDVVIVGNQTVQDLQIVRRGTREFWDAQIDYIPPAGQIVLYTDYYGEDKPAVKFGDGSAYLIDLPIASEGMTQEVMGALNAHIEDTEIHVSRADRAFWNNKLNYAIDAEELILNRQ